MSMNIKEILAIQLNFLEEPVLQSAIIDKGIITEIKAGTPILNEGSYVKTIPILLKGLIKVAKEEEGKEMLIYYIYPLESCIVSIHCGVNQVKSRIKATAEEDSLALLLPSQQIAEWQNKYSSFNKYVMNLYQKRFYDVLDAFNALAFQSLDKRLLSYLNAKTSALNSTKIYMTHQDLGDELGTARETISRMLKKLEVDKKVKLHRGRIQVIH